MRPEGRLNSVKKQALRWATGLALTAAWLAGSESFQRIDWLAYDAMQTLWTSQPPDDVVLITIDNESLRTLGRWPWSRHVHADLLDKLAAEKPLAVGLDLVLSEPQTSAAQTQDMAADARLAQSMRQLGNVVLPVVFERMGAGGQLMEVLPLPPLAAAAAALGRAHVELGPDGKARGIYLREGLGQPVWPHFAEAMLQVARGEVRPTAAPAASPGLSPLVTTTSTLAVTSPQTLVATQPKWVCFYSGRRTFTSLSYHQVVQGHFAPGTFHNKLVLVGSTALGMADAVTTPVSGLQQTMPGVEFLANTVASMRDDTLMDLAPIGLTVLVSALWAAMPMLWLPRTLPRRAAFYAIAWVLALPVLSMCLLALGHVWLPISAGICVAALAWPGWMLLQLVRTQRLMDRELQGMQGELARLNTALADSAVHDSNADIDPMVQRMVLLQRMRVQLRQAQREREDFMAFVSHDIRVPLSSALQKLDALLGPEHPVYVQLDRARAWADGFVQISRAMSLDLTVLPEVDLGAIAYEATDEVYAAALVKRIVWQRQVPDKPVWVHGEFDLLFRAVQNLLVNAVKFSPTDDSVTLRLCQEEGMAVLHVIDHGPGIAPDAQKWIFERFVTGTTPSDVPKGTGLGLFFVRTVVTRHGGQISVQSQPGRTVFTLRLPTVMGHEWA